MRITITGTSFVRNPDEPDDVEMDVFADDNEVGISIESLCCCNGNIVLNEAQLDEVIAFLQEAKRRMNENLD